MQGGKVAHSLLYPQPSNQNKLERLLQIYRNQANSSTPSAYVLGQMPLDAIQQIPTAREVSGGARAAPSIPSKHPQRQEEDGAVLITGVKTSHSVIGEAPQETAAEIDSSTAHSVRIPHPPPPGYMDCHGNAVGNQDPKEEQGRRKKRQKKGVSTLNKEVGHNTEAKGEKIPQSETAPVKQPITGLEREKELEQARKRVMDWEAHLLSSAPVSLPIDLSLKKAATPTTSYAVAPQSSVLDPPKQKKRKIGRPIRMKKKRKTGEEDPVTSEAHPNDSDLPNASSSRSQEESKDRLSEDGLRSGKSASVSLTEPVHASTGGESMEGNTTASNTGRNGEEEILPAFNLDVVPPVVKRHNTTLHVPATRRVLPSAVYALNELEL